MGALVCSLTAFSRPNVVFLAIRLRDELLASAEHEVFEPRVPVRTKASVQACRIPIESKSQHFVKGSLEEILPSYEKLRSVCVHVRDAKRSRLTVACVGTLGAAHVRRGFGACAAPAPVEIEA